MSLAFWRKLSKLRESWKKNLELELFICSPQLPKCLEQNLVIYKKLLVRTSSVMSFVMNKKTSLILDVETKANKLKLIKRELS